MLVGRNGTGKSNLLEALTIIFGDLDLGTGPSFGCVLEYVCRGRKVRIDAIPRDRPKFKWENFRFCCTYCNSRRINQVTGQGGGKADHFPLKEESDRAQWPADNLADEKPLLLDPCAAAYPRHLWFDEDGQAVPNPVFGNTDSYPYKRAETSIRFFHLNHPDIADQRKELCNRMRRRVEEADHYFNKYYSDGDATALGAFGDALRDLNAWLAPKEPYSSAARAMLMGLRGTHQVVDVVLASA